MAEMLEHDENMVGTWWSHAKDIERNMKVVTSGHGGAMDDHPGHIEIPRWRLRGRNKYLSDLALTVLVLTVG